jgi:hypothetical protein
LNVVASFIGVSGKNPQHQYKDFLSDFKIWNQKTTRKRMVDFPKIIGKRCQ